MVLTVTAGVLAVAVLVKLLVGPLRWHRLVGAELRPSSLPPTEQGQVIVNVRDMATIAVLGVVCASLIVDQVEERRTDERLYEATYTAVEILPPQTLEVGQVEALVEEITGEDVLLLDAGEDTGQNGELAVSLDAVYWAPEDESEPTEPDDLPPPAACLEITGSLGAQSVAVTEGPCDGRP